MICIRARRHADGWEISAVGHADYAERGQDIVCAGVSALLFGLVRYLTACAPSAEARGGEASPLAAETDSSGGCSPRRGEGAVPSVAYRIEDGGLWVRTHHMGDTDTAAWALTRAGLGLIEAEYPTCVRLSDIAQP